MYVFGGQLPVAVTVVILDSATPVTVIIISFTVSIPPTADPKILILLPIL
jgi:hypothetical protein